MPKALASAAPASTVSSYAPSGPVIRSLQRQLIFSWLLFLVFQQAERLFLTPETMQIEMPASGVLLRTLITGLQGDFIVATICAAVAFLAAMGIGFGLRLRSFRSGERPLFGREFQRALTGSLGILAVILLLLLTVDMGYYRYNQHHLDFVFFEYIDDLFVQTAETSVRSSQAAQQTNAELHDSDKWAVRLLVFWLVEGAAAALWWLCFKAVVGPALDRWHALSPRMTSVILLLVLVAGGFGFHPKGPYALRIAEISSGAYYTLAQNPILYATESLRAAIDSRIKEVKLRGLTAVPLPEAVRTTQEMLGHGVQFPFPQYPLVHEQDSSTAAFQFQRPANVLLIFVEGLDRRFLNRTEQGIRVTPFLDWLRTDSLYFEHFFSNGTQTARGLFASFCSYYPRQGTAAMKTRYTRDYLCLPSVLRKAGYRTEMVISEDRDLNRLHLFMSRNGLQQLFDEHDFPPIGKQIGYGPSFGWPDGALFDMVRSRVEAPRDPEGPLFLTTLTLSTHHPFTVPDVHPDTQTLRAHPDGYVSALRYVDLELERFFSRLRKDGRLKDTMIVILGDHGRHEPVGATDIEKQAGHFLAPLFIWVDESLRTGASRYPRTVSIVASQVDLTPTILGLNGLIPPVNPFLGRDMSCLFLSDCLEDNTAFLTSVYDDMVGLADRHGLSLYSLRRELFYQTDLDLATEPVTRPASDPAVASKYHRMMALYVGANTLLEQNRIWSWKELGQKP
jgi:phosphoglycerol transferase MdoB-like AlkP superfamily enzyme